LEASVELIQATPPEEVGLSPEEYGQQLEAIRELESAVSRSVTIGVPFSVAAGGLLVVALVAEAVPIVAVRMFATDEAETISRELLTDNILLATLNGTVGKIVVWGLIFLGFAFFVLPGIFFAVSFYFLRQEVALRDKNFVSGMADSWRLTKGNRIEIFAVALIVFVLSQLDAALSPLGNVVSQTAIALVGTVFSAGLAVFGAAVVTRLYVQLREGSEAEDEAVEAEKDPYDAALGPDDIPE
jgi:hypothetical protein